MLMPLCEFSGTNAKIGLKKGIVFYNGFISYKKGPHEREEEQAVLA